MLGKLLASVVRLANAPARAMEKFMDEGSERGDEDNILSKPLESIASALEEADNG